MHVGKPFLANAQCCQHLLSIDVVSECLSVRLLMWVSDACEQATDADHRRPWLSPQGDALGTAACLTSLAVQSTLDRNSRNTSGSNTSSRYGGGLSGALQACAVKVDEFVEGNVGAADGVRLPLFLLCALALVPSPELRAVLAVRVAARHLTPQAAELLQALQCEPQLVAALIRDCTRRAAQYGALAVGGLCPARLRMLLRELAPVLSVEQWAHAEDSALGSPEAAGAEAAAAVAAGAVAAVAATAGATTAATTAGAAAGSKSFAAAGAQDAAVEASGAKQGANAAALQPAPDASTGPVAGGATGDAAAAAEAQVRRPAVPPTSGSAAELSGSQGQAAEGVDAGGADISNASGAHPVGADADVPDASGEGGADSSAAETGAEVSSAGTPAATAGTVAGAKSAGVLAAEALIADIRSSHQLDADGNALPGAGEGQG